MRDPLIPPLAALGGGILLARFAAFESRELLAAMAALFALSLMAFWRNSRRLSAICSLAGLGFAGCLVALVHRPGPAPELDAGAREVVILSGCVVKPPAFSEGREQFILELDEAARAQVSLYLKDGESAPNLHYGQKIELPARVRRARNFGNPGSFDYAGYLARQDIYWTASANSVGEIRVLGGECGSGFWRAIFALRVAALQRLERLYSGKPYETGMLEATLIGETSKMQKVWTEDFRSTGTYHTLVIAGLHVTALAAVFLFLLRLCFVGEMPAFTLTVLAAWLYALVSGAQAPAVRAAAGFTFFVTGRFFYRRGRLLNLLAATAIGFLLFDPEQMFEAAFQLSFLCVAAIAAFAVPLIQATSGPLKHGLAGLAEADRDLHLPSRVAQFRIELRLIAETLRLWTRLPAKAALAGEAAILHVAFFALELAAVSAIIQIALALPMAIYFHRVSFSGLSANIVIVPLMTAAVPVGFAAIFTNWHWAAWLAEWLLRASQRVAEWHARWEPNWRIPDPPLWVAVSAAASLVLLAMAIRRAWGQVGQVPDPPVAGAGRGPAPPWIAVALATVLAMASFTLLLWCPFAPQVHRGALELTAIDVGQGDSLLVAFPNGKLMVVDGGGVLSFGHRAPSRLDIGEDVVSPYLWTRSIRRVDTLVLTHAHDDHMGGLSALVENFQPKELWTGAIQETPAWAALREKALKHGVRIVPMTAGRRFDYGGAHIEVLSPPDDYVPPAKPNNNDSLVMRLSFGAHSFLLEGDAERPMENEMLPYLNSGKTDVLKVGHHGSKTSTTPGLLEATHPAFALISLGAGNSYGHPHPDVLERLEESHTSVFRTDLWGLISIRTDGRRFRMETSRWSPEPRRLYSAF
jgi:competence protein ComEC